MKKLLSLVALLFVGVSIAGCGDTAPSKPATPAPSVEKGTEAAKEGAGSAPAGEEKATEDKPAEEKPAEEKKEE